MSLRHLYLDLDHLGVYSDITNIYHRQDTYVKIGNEFVKVLDRSLGPKFTCRYRDFMNISIEGKPMGISLIPWDRLWVFTDRSLFSISNDVNNLTGERRQRVLVNGKSPFVIITTPKNMVTTEIAEKILSNQNNIHDGMDIYNMILKL